MINIQTGGFRARSQTLSVTIPNSASKMLSVTIPNDQNHGGGDTIWAADIPYKTFQLLILN